MRQYNGEMDFTELASQATEQYGLLSASQLKRAGYSRGMVATRVRAGTLRRRTKRVLQLAGTPASWEQDLLAAVLTCDPVAAASHRAASRLWGFRTVDDEVEVSIRFPRNIAVDGAVVHRIRDLSISDITVVDGIATTTPERTICDLGLIFPEHEVHRILRQAVADRVVLPHDLWTMRERTSKQGRNGTGVLERVLKQLPEGIEFAESGLEIHFLEVCERFGIPAPVPQLPVRAAGRNYRLDFAWVAQRVFVEIDGAAFHSSIKQIADDGNRQNLLVRSGWTPLRFTATDLRDRPAFTAKTIRDLLEATEDLYTEPRV